MTSLLIALLAVGQTVVTIQPAVVDPKERSHYDVFRAPACMKIDGTLAEVEWGNGARNQYVQ